MPTENLSTRQTVIFKAKEKPLAVTRGCLQDTPKVTWGDRLCQVEIPESTKTQYSNSSINNLNNSNSILKQEENTVTVTQLITNLADVIPQDDYLPYYISQYRKLGYKRYIELANKARRSGKDPKRLFFWMLKNNEIVQ